MLKTLSNILTNSINSLGITCSEGLSKYILTRTLTQIKTIKAYSKHISNIHRTTIVKNIQKLSEVESCLCTQLYNLPNILSDGRFKYSAIIDSTLLRRWSEKVYSCKVRYNYVEKHKKPYQEQINCCIYHEKKGLIPYTLQ